MELFFYTMKAYFIQIIYMYDFLQLLFFTIYMYSSFICHVIVEYLIL